MSEIYLDTYVLQQDMRIRLPRCVVSNLNLTKGISKLDVFLDSSTQSIVLRPSIDEDKKGSNGVEK